MTAQPSVPAPEGTESTDSVDTVDADVIVVGAGPVGLAAALLLAQYGLSGIVVDRRSTRSAHPKARGLRLRASELAALWGFDEDLRRIAMPSEIHRFIYCETVAGEEIARTATMASADGTWSAVPPYRVSQDRLEAIMEARVVADDRVPIRRGFTATAVHDEGSTVTVDLVDERGERSRLRARALIAADGVGSAIRQQLGVAFGTGGPTPYWHSLCWRGDLSAYVADRPAIMYYTRTGGGSLVGVAPAGRDDRWVTIAQNPPSAERPDPLTPEEGVALIRRAVGRDDLVVDLESSETFRISADVAERYRVGRVFLAGDAAHSLPPTGGFGINTGFADVHNLVWKLAAVLAGRAPDRLLDSYDTERRPVARSNADWSTVNAKRFVAVKQALMADERDELRRLLTDQQSHVDPLAQDLGFRYGDLDPDAPPAYAHVVLGGRAPHALVDDGGGPRSTLAVLDGELTLVVARADSPWVVVGAPESGVRVLTLGEGPLTPVDGTLAERFDLGQDGAALIRPDGHVGWVVREATGDLRARLAAALSGILDSGLAG